MNAAPSKSLRDTLYELGLSDRDIWPELPVFYGDIARTVGLPTTLELIDALSGQQIYVPVQVNNSSKLAAAIGQESAQKIADLRGGDCHIVLPLAFGERTLTRLHGVKLLKAGATTNEVVAKLKVSRRTVIGWRAKYKDKTWGEAT